MIQQSPECSHLTTLDFAISAARSAKQALSKCQSDIADLALTQCRSQVRLLRENMAAEQFSELSQIVVGLFQFVHRNLAFADIEQSTQRVDDALRVLEIHRESWLAVVEELDADNFGIHTLRMLS